MSESGVIIIRWLLNSNLRGGNIGAADLIIVIVVEES
jgi:hypothetical protein